MKKLYLVLFCLYCATQGNDEGPTRLSLKVIRDSSWNKDFTKYQCRVFNIPDCDYSIRLRLESKKRYLSESFLGITVSIDDNELYMVSRFDNLTGDHKMFCELEYNKDIFCYKDTIRTDSITVHLPPKT